MGNKFEKPKSNESKLERFVKTKYGPVKVFIFKPDVLTSTKFISDNEFPFSDQFYRSKVESPPINELSESKYSIQYHITKNIESTPVIFHPVSKSNNYNVNRVFYFDLPMLAIIMNDPSSMIFMLNFVREKIIEHQNNYNLMLHYYCILVTCNFLSLNIEHIENSNSSILYQYDNEKYYLPLIKSSIFKYFVDIDYFRIIEEINSGTHELFNKTNEVIEDNNYIKYILINNFILSKLDIDIGGIVDHTNNGYQSDYQLIIGNPAKYLSSLNPVSYPKITRHQTVFNLIDLLSRFRNIDFQISSGNILDQIIWSLIINDQKFKEIDEVDCEQHRIESAILFLIRIGEFDIDPNYMKYNSNRNEIIIGLNRPNAEVLFDRLCKIINGEIVLKNYDRESKKYHVIDFDILMNDIVKMLKLDKEHNQLIRSILLRQSNPEVIDRLFPIIEQSSVRPNNKSDLEDVDNYFTVDSISTNPFHFPFLYCPDNRYPCPKIRIN